MYNWTVDINHLKKYPEKYKKWKVEQLINFGLNNEKIARSDLKKYIGKINVDPDKRSYIKFLLKNDRKNKYSIKRSS